MKEVFVTGVSNMLIVVVAACLIVLGAMAIDLVCGLYKAKQRNEIRSSWGLKRTLSKFIMYEGGMMIACGIDLLLHFSHILSLFGLTELANVPVVTCLVGIFLLIVEYISIREKADQKTKTELSRVETFATKMLTKEDFREIMIDVLKQLAKVKRKEE